MRCSSLASAIVLSLVGFATSFAYESNATLGSPEALMEAMAAKDPAVVRAAFAPLAAVESLGAEYRPLLRMGMRHDDERVRLYSALGLSASGEASDDAIKEILQSIAAAKASYLPEADLIAQWSLEKQGVNAMPVLLAALRHDSMKVQYHGLAVIEKIGPPAREALPHVAHMVDDGNMSIIRRAVMAKWRIDGDDRFAVDHLLPLLSFKRERQCGGAVDCLAKMGIGARRAIPVLVKLMNEHKDPAVIEALGELAPHFSWGVGPALRRSLNDPELSGRATAVLFKLDGPDEYLLPHLANMMNREGNIEIERHYLAEALGAFGPKAAPAIPGLIRTLKSPSGQTRINAAETLGKIGPAAKEALPALRESLSDQDAAVAAKQAIALIEK